MNGKLHGESWCWGIAVNITDNTYVISWYNTHKASFRKCEERKNRILHCEQIQKFFYQKFNGSQVMNFKREFCLTKENLNKKWIMGQHLLFLLGTAKKKKNPAFLCVHILHSEHTLWTLNRMKTCLKIINSLSAAILNIYC